jgi:hypothetical protein
MQQAAPETIPTPPTMHEAPAPTRGASASTKVVIKPHWSARLRGPPKRYGEEVLLLVNDEPAKYKEDMMVPNSIKMT